MTTTFLSPQYTIIEETEQSQTTSWWRRIIMAFPNAAVPRRTYTSTPFTEQNANTITPQADNEIPIEFLAASEELLAAIWDNDEDAIYDTM